MVAEQFRTVFARRRPGSLTAGLAETSQIRYIFEVCVVASNYSNEDQSASDGGDEPAKLPFRSGGVDHPASTAARAELRDRETYYTELRFAVHCQSRSIPLPRAAHDDLESDSWASAGDRDDSASEPDSTSRPCGAELMSRTDEEVWNEMVVRFGDTWT
jgi:hypothetical protein